MSQIGRDRDNRNEKKHSRFMDDMEQPRDRSPGRKTRGMLYISNIPPGTPWGLLKDFFRTKVGDVAFVETKDTLGRIEFTNIECMKKAMSMRSRLIFKGVPLVVHDSEFEQNLDGPGPGPGMGPGHDHGPGLGHGPGPSYGHGPGYGPSRSPGPGLGHRHGPDHGPGPGHGHGPGPSHGHGPGPGHGHGPGPGHGHGPGPGHGPNPGHGPGRGPGHGPGPGPMDRNYGRNGSMPHSPPPPEKFNTYGLSVNFLEGLGIEPPLVPNIFVHNLDYRVDMQKFKEVFRLAGKIRYIAIGTDKEGRSKGFGEMRYNHPVEAVQAISMFNNQYLYDRKMIVKMNHSAPEKAFKVPDGLKGMGPGLGPNGDPLEDVLNNLPDKQPNKQPPEPPEIIAEDIEIPNQMNTMMAAATNMNLANMGGGMANMGGGFNMSALNPATLQALNVLQNQLLQQAQATANMPNMTFGVNSASTVGSGMNSNPNQDQPNNMVPVVRPPVSRKEPADSPNKQKISDMVFINNLPPNISWQILREKFGECGEVKCAELTGSNSAIVRFQRDWDAQRAVKMFNGTCIDDHIINCRFY